MIYGTPTTISSGLEYYLDASGRFSLSPITGTTTPTRVFTSISNGTTTVVDETLPDNTNGLCIKMTTGSFTNNVTVANASYNCIGTSTFSVFVKPIDCFYVMLRDGDTTNAQVWFDLTNGTIVGGNNTSNGSITSFPNGWYLLTMTINRAGDWSYGTRIGMYIDNTFSGYTSPITPINILYLNPSISTLSRNLITNPTNTNVVSIPNNIPLINNNFIFSGITSNRIDITSNLVNNISNQCTIEFGFTLLQTINAASLTQGLISSSINTNNRVFFSFVGGRLVYRYVINGVNTIDILSNRTSWIGGYIVQLVLDNGNIVLYVNGQIEPTTITANNLPSYGYLYKNPINISIGASYTGNAFIQSLNANVSFVKIYNRSLTYSEINQNYNALKSRFRIQ